MNLEPLPPGGVVELIVDNWDKIGANRWRSASSCHRWLLHVSQNATQQYLDFSFSTRCFYDLRLGQPQKCHCQFLNVDWYIQRMALARWCQTGVEGCRQCHSFYAICHRSYSRIGDSVASTTIILKYYGRLTTRHCWLQSTVVPSFAFCW